MSAPVLALDLWAVPGPGFLAAVAVILSALGVFVFRGRIAARRDAAALADLRGRLREVQDQADHFEVVCVERQRADAVRDFAADDIARELHRLSNAISRTMRSAEVQALIHATGEEDSAATALGTQAERLARLGDAIRGWSAGAVSRIDLNLKEVDLDESLKSLVTELVPFAEQEGVRLAYDGPEAPVLCWIDEKRLEKVVSGLVGNALAFTDSGGEITVFLLLEAVGHGRGSRQTTIARVSIADTGVSLTPEEAAEFFERDPPGPSPMIRAREAGSLRLTMAREYVEMHGGTLSVKSRSGAGCVFSFTIPMGSGQGNEVETASGGHPAVALSRSDLVLEEPRLTEFGGKPTILVVDDDEDLLSYLEQALQPAFRPIKARNGREALDLLTVEPPDLVLCDHGMPVMDGIELLEAVRTDEALRTIPFVLLTGRASVQDRVEGLRRGADAYIVKPFVVAEVVVQMQNLLRLRDTMREQYGTLVFPVEATAPEMQSADALFVAEARRVVEAHLADPDFDVRAMSERLFVSERTLRRHIRDLTGYSAAKFILELRLQRARQLLDGNVVKTLSEAAAAVGFRDPGYFSRLLQSWRRVRHPGQNHGEIGQSRETAPTDFPG